MNKKVLRTLEFDKIVHRLAEHATSPGGKALCNHIEPLSDINKIKEMQTQTSDALTRIIRVGSISFSGIRDIADSMARLEIGGTLSTLELLNISSILQLASRASSYGKKQQQLDGIDGKTDSLDYMFTSLDPLSFLNKAITKCIISQDEISDDASPNLKSIRRKLHNCSNQIHTQLNSMVNSTTVRTYLQDNVITMRNGRYCIPVKMEYKNMVPGMIHDQSSSGSTVFIEPMSIVKLNNEIKDLELQEQEEIDRILAELSKQCAEYISTIDTNYRLLCQLDFIFARAAYAKSIRATKPVFRNEKYIELKSARHPLIDPYSVVPINVTLGKDFEQLIITGPNTGGKTCSLKTVGLLTLMGQAGLHIPADENSSLVVFKEVYADIGDEQSIEQNLSTFSSHIKNIVKILEQADQDCLVLFDELCAGTDPVEGAAHATSILSFLRNLSIMSIATTHYSELKVYALSTEGVENGSCEFNVDTLSPTYRLLIGVPGKSNAFAISAKLGIPDFIIENAKKQIAAEDVHFEDVITDLERSKVVIDDERKAIEEYKAEVAALKNRIKEQNLSLEKKKQEIISKAKEQAEAILQDAKESADKTIRDMNKQAKAGDFKGMENTRRLAREKYTKASEKNKNNTAKTQNHKIHKPKDFHIGDKVKVLSMNVEGIVRTLPDNSGNMQVQMGILSSRINIKDVIIINEGPVVSKSSTTGASKISMSKSMSISPEIKLLGMTGDEAISALDKYLDDAYLSHLSSVRIVHGKGTGALRNAVWQYLKRCSYVKKYHLAEYGEGDAGVTIAEFKEN